MTVIEKSSSLKKVKNKISKKISFDNGSENVKAKKKHSEDHSKIKIKRKSSDGEGSYGLSLNLNKFFLVTFGTTACKSFHC